MPREPVDMCSWETNNRVLANCVLFCNFHYRTITLFTVPAGFEEHPANQPLPFNAVIS